MTLNDLVTHFHKGRLPDGAVVLTKEVVKDLLFYLAQAPTVDVVRLDEMTLKRKALTAALAWTEPLINQPKSKRDAYYEGFLAGYAVCT
jgi:hypothetical protein